MTLVRSLIAMVLVPMIAACSGAGGSSAPPGILAASNSQDDTDTIQAAVDRGGGVTFEPRTYRLTRTIVINHSNTTLVGSGPQTIFSFQPSGPRQQCVNDRAFTTPCAFNRALPRRIANPIVVGDTSFTVATAQDVADIQPGDWLLINDRDRILGDRAAVDWAQVARVSGIVIDVVQPFRMAFTTARTWIPGHSGLGFVPLKPLVENIELRNFALVTPTAPGISVFGALHVSVDHVSVSSPAGQPLYSYLSKDVTFTNNQTSGGTTLSEFAATVDLHIRGNVFKSESAGFGLDLGSAYFDVTGNTVSQSMNIGAYFLYGVHDGTVTGTNIAFVDTSAPNRSAAGILVWGSQNILLSANDLAGGAGADSVGIDVRPYDSEIPLPDTGVRLRDNTISDFAVAERVQ